MCKKEGKDVKVCEKESQGGKKVCDGVKRCKWAVQRRKDAKA